MSLLSVPCALLSVPCALLSVPCRYCHYYVRYCQYHVVIVSTVCVIVSTMSLLSVPCRYWQYHVRYCQYHVVIVSTMCVIVSTMCVIVSTMPLLSLPCRYCHYHVVLVSTVLLLSLLCALLSVPYALLNEVSNGCSVAICYTRSCSRCYRLFWMGISPSYHVPRTSENSLYFLSVYRVLYYLPYLLTMHDVSDNGHSFLPLPRHYKMPFPSYSCLKCHRVAWSSYTMNVFLTNASAVNINKSYLVYHGTVSLHKYVLSCCLLYKSSYYYWYITTYYPVTRYTRLNIILSTVIDVSLLLFMHSYISSYQLLYIAATYPSTWYTQLPAILSTVIHPLYKI